MHLSQIIAQQRSYFQSGATLPLSHRIKKLSALQTALQTYGPSMLSALQKDLSKSPYEGVMSELSMIHEELSLALKCLKRWAKPRSVPAPLSLCLTKSVQQPVPYGVVLIFSPWNYPFQLSLIPLISAVAAGNCVLLKPSPLASACEQALIQLIASTFSPDHVTVVPGDAQVYQQLLTYPFDYIFFTGSSANGREVMAKAAQFLTPVTLELGGKSPVLVLDDAELTLTARRILFGKLLNGGQTCVAPDYALVPASLFSPLVEELKRELHRTLGSHPLSNPHLPQIINAAHHRRLQGLLTHGRILWGGTCEGLKMVPALMDQVDGQSPLMQEEIFGPILPLIPFQRLDEALAWIQDRPKPLALYLFTQSKRRAKDIFSRLSFGGACLNDTIMHLTNPNLPFGGIGSSGMGQYHGKAGFDTFSHPQSILFHTSPWDISLRYHPYTLKKQRVLEKFYPFFQKKKGNG